MKKLKQRQRIILEALLNCGGTATTKQIATKAKLNANGISQTLGALEGEFVNYFGGKEPRWKLKTKKLPPISKALWAKLNARRIALIDLEVYGKISPEDRAELEDIQKTTGRHVEALRKLYRP